MPEPLTIGQDVYCVTQDGYWHREQWDDRWFEHTDHVPVGGRVISAGNGVVVVWPDGGKAPLFVAEADVFADRDWHGYQARIKELNVEAFGHPDGKWAASRAKEIAAGKGD